MCFEVLTFILGLSPTSLKMQLTYFDGTVTSQGDSEELAMEGAALAMLKVILLQLKSFPSLILFTLGGWTLD